MYIRDILQAKGSGVTTATPAQTVHEVSIEMSQRRIGALPVVEDGGIVGMISERDIAYAFAESGDKLADRSVGELMAHGPRTCSPDDRVVDCLGMMSKRRIRHLPVVQDGRLAGIVSIGDLVQHRLDAVIAEADQLRDFIQT